MVETNLFWNMQMPICILFKKCHITYLLIDKVGYEVGNRARPTLGIGEPPNFEPR